MKDSPEANAPERLPNSIAAFAADPRRTISLDLDYPLRADDDPDLRKTH